MSEAGKTGKRIVSKGRYAKLVSIKISLTLLAVGFGLYTVYNTANSFRLILTRPAGISFVAIIPLIALIVALPWISVFGIKHMARIAKTIDPGVPLTRANTADLPALESLVRASAEPTQAQEAILLRAATQTSETPAEQLVRSVGGQE